MRRCGRQPTLNPRPRVEPFAAIPPPKRKPAVTRRRCPARGQAWMPSSRATPLPETPPAAADSRRRDFRGGAPLRQRTRAAHAQADAAASAGESNCPAAAACGRRGLACPRLARLMCLLVAASLAGSTGCVHSLNQWAHNHFKLGPNYSPPPAPVSPALGRHRQSPGRGRSESDHRRRGDPAFRTSPPIRSRTARGGRSSTTRRSTN